MVIGWSAQLARPVRVYTRARRAPPPARFRRSRRRSRRRRRRAGAPTHARNRASASDLARAARAPARHPRAWRVARTRPSAACARPSQQKCRDACARRRRTPSCRASATSPGRPCAARPRSATAARRSASAARWPSSAWLAGGPTACGAARRRSRTAPAQADPQPARDRAAPRDATGASRATDFLLASGAGGTEQAGARHDLGGGSSAPTAAAAGRRAGTWPALPCGARFLCQAAGTRDRIRAKGATCGRRRRGRPPYARRRPQRRVCTAQP